MEIFPIPIFVSEKAASVLVNISHGGDEEGASMGIRMSTHFVLDSASFFSKKSCIQTCALSRLV